jgi:hypothetical protein
MGLLRQALKRGSKFEDLVDEVAAAFNAPRHAVVSR